jgi:hypothetical protein
MIAITTNSSTRVKPRSRDALKRNEERRTDATCFAIISAVVGGSEREKGHSTPFDRGSEFGWLAKGWLAT